MRMFVTSGYRPVSLQTLVINKRTWTSKTSSITIFASWYCFTDSEEYLEKKTQIKIKILWKFNFSTWIGIFIRPEWNLWKSKRSRLRSHSKIHIIQRLLIWIFSKTEGLFILTVKLLNHSLGTIITWLIVLYFVKRHCLRQKFKLVNRRKEINYSRILPSINLKLECPTEYRCLRAPKLPKTNS